MIRVEIRIPSPPPRVLSSSLPLPTAEPRSGSLVVDIHALKLVAGNERVSRSTFSTSSAKGKLVAKAKWKCLVLSLAGAKEPRAVGFVSLKPSSDDRSEIPAVEIRALPTPKDEDVPPTSIACRIPFVDVKIDDKATLDNLQYWMDDLSQWAERLAKGESTSTGTNTVDSSLIGSKFFASTPRGAGSLATIKSAGTARKPGTTVVSVILDKASVRLFIARGPMEGTRDLKPIIIRAADASIVVDMKPLDKQTDLNIKLNDLHVVDVISKDNVVTLLEAMTPLNENGRALLHVTMTSGFMTGSTAKKSSINIDLSGFVYHFSNDIDWVSDVIAFVKAPPGVFEAVVPNEQTDILLRIFDGSVRFVANDHPGALVVAVHEFSFNTQLVNEALETQVKLGVPWLSFLFIDHEGTLPGPDMVALRAARRAQRPEKIELTDRWMILGYIYLGHLTIGKAVVATSSQPQSNMVDVEKVDISLHLCADTMAGVSSFGASFGAVFQQKAPAVDVHPMASVPDKIQVTKKPKRDMFASIDEDAFRAVAPEDTPGDFIDDDIPKNPEYLDAEYGASGGVAAYSDDEDFGALSESADSTSFAPAPALPSSPISRRNDDTIRVFNQDGLNIIEDFYDTVTPIDDQLDPVYENPPVLTLRLRECNVKVGLHDGYDYVATQKAFENAYKAFLKKLLGIRDLISKGQAPDESLDEATQALVFNAVYIRLNDKDDLEGSEWIAAIDRELAGNDFDDSATQSSVSRAPKTITHAPHPTLPSKPYKPRVVRGKELTRSKGPQVLITLRNISADFDKLHPNEPELVSRALVTIKDVLIEDKMRQSTWFKFLTSLNSWSPKYIRETDSNMVKVELQMVKPTRGLKNEEARLKLKVLPIRLNVDQDPLDFLKAFGAFSPPDGPSKPMGGANAPKSDEIFFQLAEVFPIVLMLDYKPKRVDYRALREGRTIELMNFFHFKDAEMTLRHIRLNGITGWATLGETLNDLWTPDVKANQLAPVISGITPIRSLVNLGSGLADLVLIPIAQYRKDGRVIRGLQRGARNFTQTTGLETVSIAAKLATGTLNILEQAEVMLVGKQSTDFDVGSPVSTGSPNLSATDPFVTGSEDEGGSDNGGTATLRSAGGERRSTSGEGSSRNISRYAEPPRDVREGVQAAYKSLGTHLKSTAQTILAVPVEVYEKTSDESAVRKVIKVVPIAAIKPLIGLTEAASKTFLGLQNTIDPNGMAEAEDKYKR